jgi:hypothetical protein
VEYAARRHEVLWTTFHEHNGRPVQLVHPPGAVDVPLVDLSSASDPEAEAAELIAREGLEPFDLERSPLFRIRVARIADDEHWLIRVNHHINSDGWSWKVLLDEIGELYEAFRRGDPPPLPDRAALDYADHAVWERRFMRPDTRRFHDDVAWWREALDGAPAGTKLPFVRPTPDKDARPSDGVIWWGMRPEVSSELTRIGREVGATFFMTRAAALAARLAIESGEDDVILGTYATTRRLAETQRMFGFFSNLTTLRLRFARELSFKEWLEQVRTVVIEASAHSEIPYGMLSEELLRQGTPPPAIKAIVGTSEHLPPVSFGGVEATTLKRTFYSMPWSFSCVTSPWYEADRCLASFDARVHDPRGVRVFIDGLKELCSLVSAEPQRPLEDLLGEAQAITAGGSS